MSSRGSHPTTTSFALLGLLALRPWTTYELAGQMDRGLGRFWPRARSNVFEEPKKLVALKLAKATTERVGRRMRTVYSITPKGRRALAGWLGEPGEGPVLEWEQLVKVFFADAGTKSDLLATLRQVAQWPEQEMLRHRQRARSYVDGEGPFPERLPIHGLVGGFLADFATMTADWCARAISTVESWPEDIRSAPPDWEILERVAEVQPRPR